MSRLYDVTIECLGLKKKHILNKSTISLSTGGTFLIMDERGVDIRFAAYDCKVEQIAAHVIVIRGYTDKPQHVTFYCAYNDA